MRFHTPLRYPGGKRKLANYMKLVFRYNNLLDGQYVEPYAGGAGIALALLFEEYASHIHINDLSKRLYAFWHSVLYETEALCTLIQDTEVTMNEWYRQRDIQAQTDEVSLLNLGFSTFFLNRTNRSGILRGGVIGGKDQTGPYKLDARYNKQDLSRRIKRIARYKGRISIYNEDAADFITTIVSTLPNNTLIYLDPPYYIKGQELYENYYRHEDHERISTLVANINQKWIVSYDERPEILQFYDGYRHITYHLSYSATERYKGSEVMFFSDDLDIPVVTNPAKISNRTVSRLQANFPI